MSKEFDPRDRKILLDFWEKLPELKIVKDSERTFYSHSARQLIMKVLGMGIQEQVTDKKAENIIRRALNTQEIYQAIQDLKKSKPREFDIKDFDLSLHNLYFHIQKLEEAGLIKPVAILREGRHNVTYYGRTARIMFFNVEYEEYEQVKNAFTAMEKLAPKINPKIKTEDIRGYYDRYVKIGKTLTKKMFEKLADYEQGFNTTDVDPIDILNFLELVYSINLEFTDLFKEVAKNLDIKIDG
ncbi:MAG: helix-turn-helix transcriptional regulator [Asgard group archaeon]|nr:helix-turn-helix transcriptional regulator [Asgard group archaeon]